MKNTILKLSLAVILLSFTNCSSSDDRADGGSTTPTTNNQTNADYVKSMIVGNWYLSATNYNGTWNNVTNPPNTTPYFSKYQFLADGHFSYKPYTSQNDSSMNIDGTYTIIPASGSVKPKIVMSYYSNGVQKQKTISLEVLTSSSIDVSEINVTCPSGTCFERFTKS